MKTKIFSLAVLTLTVLMTACSNDEDWTEYPSTSNPSVVNSSKTVLIYMAGRNTLTNAAYADLKEIKEGSKRIGANDCLLVFMRRYNKKDEQPWLARIKNGVVTDSLSLSDMGVTSSDGLNRASDPAVMEGVMRYAYSHYPAMGNNYGLVLWGHGSGWLVMDEVKRPMSRAYGVDNGKNSASSDGLWINIPVMADILKSLPHLKFIMCDCCNMMCLENLYELRSVADYIIGSPAEMPGQGAPYDQIVPDFFSDGNFYSRIIDKYYQSVNGQLPLTAVKTSEMEPLAKATRQAMQAVTASGAFAAGTYPDMKGLIHYYYTSTELTFNRGYNIFYDAGDFFLTYAPQEVYQQWKQALDRAVVDHRIATCWRTYMSWDIMYNDFKVTEEKMHGVSMFVPQNPAIGNYARFNENVRQLEWTQAIM